MPDISEVYPYIESSSPASLYQWAAKRGALWTSPVWLAILAMILTDYSRPFSAFLESSPTLDPLVTVLFMGGSSLCFFFAAALTTRPMGFKDAAIKGLGSALAVSAAYLFFAFISQFSADQKAPAWGGAFGLLSAIGAQLAALSGGLARAAFGYLSRTVLNPYKDPPEEKEK